MEKFKDGFLKAMLYLLGIPIILIGGVILLLVSIPLLLVEQVLKIFTEK